MSDNQIINKINADFNDKVRKRPIWSRVELMELHKSVCKFYLDPVKRRNVGLLHGFYDDVN
jgi:hypothetical protein